ncbi:hypothetical protein PsorP6_003181 [Peronosclerospora sorghi]|uniref:Uncharacterized protein n=1 Tax=Peronosclerospora sorghi TaxID=230839 RepID=A0ACC0VJE5_9STRA|nr:hypothetical protein PsorP6_003181 [Peronosclerospora sorghi]
MSNNKPPTENETPSYLKRRLELHLIRKNRVEICIELVLSHLNTPHIARNVTQFSLAVHEITIPFTHCPVVFEITVIAVVVAVVVAPVLLDAAVVVPNPNDGVVDVSLLLSLALVDGAFVLVLPKEKPVADAAGFADSPEVVAVVAPNVNPPVELDAVVGADFASTVAVVPKLKPDVAGAAALASDEPKSKVDVFVAFVSATDVVVPNLKGLGVDVEGAAAESGFAALPKLKVDDGGGAAAASLGAVDVAPNVKFPALGAWDVGCALEVKGKLVNDAVDEAGAALDVAPKENPLDGADDAVDEAGAALDVAPKENPLDGAAVAVVPVPKLKPPEGAEEDVEAAVDAVEPKEKLKVMAVGMVNYGMGGTPVTARGDQSTGFLDQLHDGSKEMAGMETEPFVMDFSSKSQNRNRGNYRCSKCGEPKKGHVCPLVPSNYKCNRCGLSRKSCTCVAPTMRTIGVQVEMDEDMTTRVLDLSLQGVIEFQKTPVPYAPPSNNAS